MKPITRATIAPILVLLGAIALPACQTPAKTEVPKAAPITAAAARPTWVTTASPATVRTAGAPARSPSLNGQSADALVKSMNDFKSGARPSTVMGRHGKGYSDAEIAAIAKYISSFK